MKRFSYCEGGVHPLPVIVDVADDAGPPSPLSIKSTTPPSPGLLGSPLEVPLPVPEEDAPEADAPEEVAPEEDAPLDPVPPVPPAAPDAPVGALPLVPAPLDVPVVPAPVADPDANVPLDPEAVPLAPVPLEVPEDAPLGGLPELDPHAAVANAVIAKSQ